jgi:hypothetical protein
MEDGARDGIDFQPLHQALIGQQQRVVRLSEDCYLVQWEPRSDLWCVVKMAALDQHGATCAAFRFRKYCEHLELISRLCSAERQLTGKVAE